MSDIVAKALLFLPTGDISEKVIDEVAKAIHDNDDGQDTTWPESETDDGHRGGRGYVRLPSYELQQMYRQQAYAAITAFRAGMVEVYTPHAKAVPATDDGPEIQDVHFHGSF
jgi:hypothetical protein